MARRLPRSESPLNQKQQDLARREDELRNEVEKLQRMIEEAPRVAEEKSRRQREELLRRAYARGSRLDASVALRDKRWGDEDTGRQRPRSLRKERREGRVVFLLLVMALVFAVIWLVTHFHL